MLSIMFTAKYHQISWNILVCKLRESQLISEIYDNLVVTLKKNIPNKRLTSVLRQIAKFL